MILYAEYKLLGVEMQTAIYVTAHPRSMMIANHISILKQMKVIVSFTIV